MPRLRPPRKEQFCRRYVGSLNAAAAARYAGYAPQSCRTTAYKLLREPAVQARIAELQAEDARQVGRETETIIGKLESVFRLAVEYHHFSSAVRILEMQAKLAGIRPLVPDGGKGGDPDGKMAANPLGVIDKLKPTKAKISNDNLDEDDEKRVAAEIAAIAATRTAGKRSA
ncbi:MAG: terminase small subunit [Rhodospirillales bacterium]|nr:terminase small subunit [Rhodospirillales bacterium]